MRTLTLLVVLVALGAPAAAAPGNVFSDPACIGESPCVSPTVCVERYSCQPTTCDPVVSCSGSAVLHDECNRKPEIEGETCQRSLDVAVAGTDDTGQPTGAGASVALTDGEVNLRNLRNGWFSHGAQVRLLLGGGDAGTTTVALYRSNVESSNGNNVTQYGVAAWQGAGTGVLVGLVFLDGRPETCYVRVDPVAAAECPRTLP